MLPSPLGLLEYDVLEDAVYLGPGRRGGLRAAPTPFKGATVTLERSGEDWVARALPGEAPPEVNGEAGEAVLADGDRIRLGELVALFRTQRGPLAAPPPPERPPPERRAPSTPPRRNPAVAVVTLTGLALLLAATYRAVNHLKVIQAARRARQPLPELAPFEPGQPRRATRDLKALDAEARQRPKRHAQLVALYRDFQRRHPGTPEAEAAGDRVREQMQAWSEQERARLDREVAQLLEAHQFARALEEVRTFETRFGSTQAAEGLDALRADVRRRARTALDALVAKAGPLITPQPRAAHRMLIGASHEFPPDMAAEVVALVERCVARMAAEKPRRPPPEPARGPARKSPPPSGPGGETGLPPLPKDSGPAPIPGGKAGDREAQCHDAWKAAHADLLAGRYPQALRGYTLLRQQFAATALYRKEKEKILAGWRAARAGALGPQALVRVPVQQKRGRLEMEYEFNDPREFEDDWIVEQPFASEMPVQARCERGGVVMEKATGLLHRLVFLPDVHLEATIAVQQPHDFGAFAVQDSDTYRAILFDVANTRFKLKKGAAAKVHAGHVLWYIGQGVWRDADPDAQGFIRIAERTTVKLQSGDVIKLDFVRRKDTAEGSFQGRTDGVRLEGHVKGDDGSTMGPARVGLFTNSGVIVVRSVRISGVVDMDWFRKELTFLASADPGPQD
jgi:hypothetical protein